MIALTSLFHANSNKTNNIQSDHQHGTFDILYDIKWLASLNLARLGIEKTTLMQ